MLRSATVLLPVLLLLMMMAAEAGASEPASESAAAASAAEPPRASAAPPADTLPFAREDRDSLSAAFAGQSHARPGPGPIAIVLDLLVLLYREGLSPVDGPSCPFHPSCSRFARQAVGLHGPVAGTLMAGDRLLRCNGSGRDRYPRVGPEGKLHDPPTP